MTLEKTMTVENNETDFAVNHGRVKIRAEWLFRAVATLMLIVSNLQTFWLARKFVGRDEYQQSNTRMENAMQDVKQTLVSVEREMAVRNSSTTDQDQSRRLDDHEQRLRAVEKQMKP